VIIAARRLRMQALNWRPNAALAWAPACAGVTEKEENWESSDCFVPLVSHRYNRREFELQKQGLGFQFIDEYMAAAGIREDGKTPLFRSAMGKTGVLTDKAMNRIDAYRMVRRRAAEAGYKIKLGCHVFRATGITAYLEAGGTLENAQAMAAHESPRTAKLYDRTGGEITLDEVERITI
jgi:hypothetical protein